MSTPKRLEMIEAVVSPIEGAPASFRRHWSDDFKAEIAAESLLPGKRVHVRDIATSEYPTSATRPADSRLECSKLQARYDVDLPQWTESIQVILGKILA